MQFEPLVRATLVKRYKRFLADVITEDGQPLCIHCPNTGSMLNCMAPDTPIWFRPNTDPKRKLPGTWELTTTDHGRLACINTARANALVEEALQAGVISELNGFTKLRREVRYGLENSRIDFVLEMPGGPLYLEVKSVTLGFADSAVAAFPDAVTARGAKHLRELAQLAQSGTRAVLLYCVNLQGIEAVRVADEIDPGYARALKEAKAAGVEVLAYGCDISPEHIVLKHRLKVLGL